MDHQLEIFFDLSCPFALMAKVRIDALIRAAPRAIEVIWSPLILHAGLPEEGLDFQVAHTAHYGRRARELQLHVEQRAAALGLTIDHMRIEKVPNTLNAHCAVRFASNAGYARGAFIEAIMRAYFTEYRDIMSTEVLCAMLRSVSLNAEQFLREMESGELRAAVLAESQTSATRGARSVPSYRLNGVHIEKTDDLLPRLTFT